MKRQLSDRDGFTLLELLVAITLLGAVGAILAGGVRLSLASWESGKKRMEGHYDLTEGLYLISAQIKSTRTAFSIDERNNKVLAFSGSPAELAFVTASPRLSPAAEADGFYKNRISFDPKRGSILFSETRFFPREPASPVWKTAEIGAGRITAFSLQYFMRDLSAVGEEKYIWVDATDKWGRLPSGATMPELPKAIRIDLETEPENDDFVWPPLLIEIGHNREIRRR